MPSYNDLSRNAPCSACLPNQPCPGHMPKKPTCTCSEFWKPCPHCVKEHFEGRLPHLALRHGTIVAGPIVKPEFACPHRWWADPQPSILQANWQPSTVATSTDWSLSSEIGYVSGKADEGRTSYIQAIKNFLFKKKELPMKRTIQVKFSALEAVGCTVSTISPSEGTKRVHWPGPQRSNLGVYTDSEHKDFFRTTLHSDIDTPLEKFLREKKVPRIIEFQGSMPEHPDWVQQSPQCAGHSKRINPPATLTRVITADLMQLAEAGFHVQHDGKLPAKVALPDHKGLLVSESANCLKLTTQMIDTPHGQLSTQRVLEADLLKQMRRAGIDHTITREVTYPKPELKVVSIQVAATRHHEDGVEVVPEDAEDKTHYSIYLRREDGCAEIHTDFHIRMHGNMARSHTLAQAARLSIEHQVPIERIP